MSCVYTTTAPTNNSTTLDVSLWKAYTDTAVFDWYITLQEKDRMKQCDLTYGELSRGNETNMVENYLPRHRSFNLHPLRDNTDYWFTMVCTDNQDRLYSSEKILFKTDEAVEPRVGAKYSHRRQDQLPDPDHRPDNSDFRSKAIFSLRPRNTISPHTILGAGCGLVGLTIITITSVLVLRKYSRYRAEQDQLWEEGRYELSYDRCAREELETISLNCHHQLLNESTDEDSKSVT